MSESIFPIESATTAARAPVAVPNGASRATGASPSPSRATAALSGTAGTADGRAPSREKLSAEAIAYAKGRGLSASTLEAMRVASGTASFRSGNRQGLFFPHFENGEVVGWKARALGDKDFTAKPGGKFGLWNVDQVHGSEVVYITEGEIDACSLVEAGLSEKEVVSVPHGARDHESENVERGYGYVLDALAAGLNRAEKFVLVTDNDGPGRTLRSDLAKVLGPARVAYVDFPEGIKDANEYLQKHGRDGLLGWIQAKQKPWPIAGLFRLSELPEPAPLKTWYCGFPSWMNRLHLAPGILSVVTGHPGHGKTSMMLQVLANIARGADVTAAVASFETRAKPHHRRALRSHYHGRLEHDLTDAERAEADAWNEEHFLWLVHAEHRPSLKWVLDTAEAAVIRHGARILQIDPWNKLESDRPADMRETDYIGGCLDELAIFARDMNCHVQVLAHPAKMDGRDRGKAPLLEDISGSKHWDNKVDLGIVVHRPKVWEDGQRQTESEVLVRKARYEELGHPCKLPMRLNLTTGLFEESTHTQ